MTNQQRPLTPPLELTDEQVGEWLIADGCPWSPNGQATIAITTSRLKNVASQAAQWGADAELEACCEQLNTLQRGTVFPVTGSDLRAARRPKPPSLAEKALAELDSVTTAFRIGYGGDLVCDAIRHALERLQQLEDQQ